MSHRTLVPLGLLAAALALLLPIRTAPAQPAETSPVRARAVPQFNTVRPGETFAIAVILDHDEHWHTWPGEPVGELPPELSDFLPIWTAIRAPTEDDERPGTIPAGWTVRFDTVQWAKPSEVKTGAFTGSTLTILSQVGRAVSYIPVTAPADAAPGQYTIPVIVEFQACDDTMCLPPETVRLDATVVLAADAPQTRVDPELFAGFTPPPAVPTPASAGPAAPGPLEISVFGWHLSINTAGPLGLVLLVGVGLLGGLILNFTPCVLPVIPIKIISLSQAAGNPARCLYLGLMMFLGVVAFWMAMAVVTVVFSIAAAELFGIWWFSTLVGVFIGLMGLGMLGMFVMNLPQAVYMVDPKRETAAGSFVFGVMTAVLALPCVAPFGGSAMAWAATQSIGVIVLIFGAIGVGMAAPYLILAAKPNWVNKMPRTGPASELIKQVMGLLMIAIAAFFIGSGLLGLVAEKPYLGKVLHWWVAGLIIVGAALWFAYRTFAITKSPLRRGTFTMAAAALGLSGLLIALSFTSIQKKLYEADVAAREAAGDDGAAARRVWAAYSTAAFEQAHRENKVVVLDFTAEWCLSCKALKLAVLSREDVESALTRDGVVSFLADLTSRKASGWDALKSLGERGIPLLAIFVPGQEQPIFKSNAYTPDEVIQAIDRGLAIARGSATPLSTEPAVAGSGNAPVTSRR